MHIREVIDWKKTSFNYIQIRFAYAVIAAYSVIEELGLEIRSSSDKPAKLGNGEWNPEVLEDLIMRLKKSNINIDEPIPWLIRGEETKIEIAKPIKTIKKTEWAHPEGYKDEFFITIKDSYVEITEAISYISYLRSKISSHKVSDRIFGLSVFDVANAQQLARRLILERIQMWR